LGGLALSGAVLAGLALNWPLAALLFAASVPFWLGPDRILRVLLSGGPRRRLLYLFLWERALLHAEPPGREPPGFWHYDQFMADLDEWADPVTRPYAALLAARTREWRAGALGSPLARVRREIQLGHWMRPDYVDPVATKQWQLYAAYWAAIADAEVPERRKRLVASLEKLRDSQSAPLLDLVVGSLGRPLASWPWDAIEAAALRMWPDGYALAHADLQAKTLAAERPIPLLGPDWNLPHLPIRPDL
jgi:hypothetical protein